MHVQRCFLLFRRKGPQSVSAQCRDVLFSASSLTQSLRSCRSAAASGGSMRIKLEKTERSRVKEGNPWRPFSTRSSAPEQASRNLTLKSVVAKPDRTIKIEAFPGFSCALLFCLSVYRCHSAVMAAFVSFRAWRESSSG